MDSHPLKYRVVLYTLQSIRATFNPRISDDTKQQSLNPHQITNPPGFSSRPWPRLAVVDGMARLELISERPFTDVGFQSKDHAVPFGRDRRGVR